MWSHRPSSSWASKVRAPGIWPSLVTFERTTGLRPAATTDSYEAPAWIASSGRLCSSWKFELHNTSRFCASQTTKASGMVSMAAEGRATDDLHELVAVEA